MPFNLFGESKTARDEREEAEREARYRLGLIVSEQDLYKHPAWGYFVERLRAVEEQSMESLVGCPPGEIPAIRERIKLARHLAEVPKTLEAERAQLQAVVDASEGESEDG